MYTISLIDRFSSTLVFILEHPYEVILTILINKILFITITSLFPYYINNY
ncbi:hypothetical protein VCR6J2_250077 [Vibrio coralliirubri]|nr:hypothetical protein VCR6J2_250077 [Vibrio coralliirubri]CDT60429.1 hypothetical protein VCR1J2_660051 [Vibrio coralliirubri]CDT78903.1 hypothetical protein VCR8J2_190793 [Vibrio coralliirubri]CDU14417.1 hypothetical protein VCR17J2_640099 [Vibrio coralliirubri]